MDKIKSIKRMFCVLDATVHMHATLRARLDGSIRINDLQLVGIFSNTELVARHHRDLREQCTVGFPAFGASAHVVIGRLRGNGHLNGTARTFAVKSATRKVW